MVQGREAATYRMMPRLFNLAVAFLLADLAARRHLLVGADVQAVSRWRSNARVGFVAAAIEVRVIASIVVERRCVTRACRVLQRQAVASVP